MKKAFILLTFIGILTGTCILTSCTEDENNLTNNLDGKWNLISLCCGFSESLNLNSGEYLWTIDTSNEILIVENIARIEHSCIIETGNYNLEITDTTLTFSSIQFDYYFEDGNLIVSDHPEVDGVAMEFVK